MTDTTTATADPTQDPAAIERDIRRTQDEMSRTVDRIGDQLNPRNLVNALLDKAEDNQIDARYLIDGARRNPLALAMIAGGLIWLVSDSDAKLPSFGSGTKSFGGAGEDPHHRDYVAHMGRVERMDSEDELAYQRRRDLARANFFMVERGHDEEESSFRKRLDDAAERFREKRHAWADSTRSAGSGAASRAQQAYTSNPLIGGLLAAAAGAIAGTALPLTRTEDEKLASLGETARGAIGEQKDQLLSAAREKKDALIEKVEQKAEPAGQASGGAQGGNTQAGETRMPYSGANDSEQPPRQLAAEESAEGERADWQSDDQQR